ncbi:MAG TPA: GTP cyclohydrolase I [Patescibacteria group bacterium]
MNQSKLESLFEQVVDEIDPDSMRAGLKETPRRVVKSFKELTYYNRHKSDLDKHFVFFPTKASDHLIIVSNIFFASLCEHHLLPYFGHISIGYIPSNKILGLSKFKRVIDLITKQLSVQEDLAQQIHELFWKKLEPKALIVYVEGKHTCSLVRGAKDEQSTFSVINKSDYFSKHSTELDLFLKVISNSKK